jgi:hypothetical protein
LRHVTSIIAQLAGVHKVNQKTGNETLIQIQTPASPEITDPLRELVVVVSRTRFTPTVAQRVGLATHELVENAILYGSLGSELDYALTFDPRARTIAVSVSNVAVQSRVTALNATIQRIEEVTPREAFEAGIRASATSGRAKLGLARIAHEAGMSLKVEQSGDRVVVIASRRA